MQGLNQYLIKETKAFRRKSIKEDTERKNEKFELYKQKLKEKFDEWIETLQELFSNKLYRQVLREIQEKKNNYEILSKTEFWRIKLLKAKSILKIIKRKMITHYKEIILENSTQNFSIKFWFNQIFMSLEELSLEFRFDINPHMNPNSKKVLETIKSLAECHLEFIYYLCIFSIRIGEVMPVLTYISDIDRFFPYINLLVNTNIFDYFENIYLIKIKLLIENCSYIQALDSLGNVFKLFFKDIMFYYDSESPINSESLMSQNKKDKKRNDGLCKVMQKIILAFYLRGIMFEHLGFYKNSIKAYQQCRWFSNIFMPNYNKFLFRFFRSMEKKYITYHEIFNDIQEKFDIKNNKTKDENKKKLNKKIIILRRRKLNSAKSDYSRNISISSIWNKIHKRKVNKLHRFRNSSSEFKASQKQLEKALDNIGTALYKKEESRNNSVFNKFTTNDFVLSTVHMINNLLSQPYRGVLKKMDKIEITKPEDEIDNLINKTMNIKKRNEFREELEKKARNKSKRNKLILKRNFNSCRNFGTYKKPNIKESKTTLNQKINISAKIIKIQKEKLVENKRYETNSADMNRNKMKITSYKVKQNSYKVPVKMSDKINKFSPNKDIFSKSIINKKKFLNSFFEKELNFQKKLLKLKSYDMQVVSNEYNQQQAMSSAEQDFQIIKCFAESNNAKKNLINLVRENELNNWEMPINRKLRLRTNRKMNILNISSLNNFMKMHNIRQRRGKYEPDNAAKNNDEKTKILTMECAKLEEMENKCQIQKEILRNQITGRKARYMDIYKFK